MAAIVSQHCRKTLTIPSTSSHGRLAAILLLNLQRVGVFDSHWGLLVDSSFFSTIDVNLSDDSCTSPTFFSVRPLDVQQPSLLRKQSSRVLDSPALHPQSPMPSAKQKTHLFIFSIWMAHVHDASIILRL